MSSTERLMRHETVPEQLGLTDMSKIDKIKLDQLLSSFGNHGRKGFDFGVAALGAVSYRRLPLFDEKTGEHKPFKFDLSTTKIGMIQGFLYGLDHLSSRVNVEYIHEVATKPTHELAICAEHIDSDLNLVTSLVMPSKNDIIDLCLEDPNEEIAYYTIMHVDGSPIVRADFN